MASGTSRAARTSRVLVVLVVIGAVVLAAALTIAGFFLVPQIVRTAQTAVAASGTEITLADAGTQATIPVDEGWSYLVDPFDAAHATLHSPDGIMTIDLTVISGVDPEQAATDAADVALTPFDDEPVGAATVVHARGIGDDIVAGAVVEGDAAVVFTSAPGTDYDAELARLLSRIEVSP